MSGIERELARAAAMGVLVVGQAGNAFRSAGMALQRQPR